MHRSFTSPSGSGLSWQLFAGQAAILHGSAQVTADIARHGRRRSGAPWPLAEVAAKSFERRADCAFTQRICVLPLLHRPSEVPIDVLGETEFEAEIHRCCQRPKDAGGLISIISPEDLIVLKELSGRNRDLADAQLSAQAAVAEERKVPPSGPRKS